MDQPGHRRHPLAWVWIPEGLNGQPPPPRRLSAAVYGASCFCAALDRAVTVSLFGLALASGETTAKAQTLAFATLILAQLIYVYDCRAEGALFSKRRRNFLLDGAVLSSSLLMAAAIHHPLLRTFFGTEPLSAGEWAIALAAAFIPALADLLLLLLKKFISGYRGKKRPLISNYS